MVLLVLAVIWAAVLVPPMWRQRVDNRPADSIKQFHRHLRVLNGGEPHGYSRALTAQAGTPIVTAPMTYRRPQGMRPSAELRRRRTIERRRNVLFALVAAVAVTFVLALTGIKAMLMLNIVSDLALAGYVALLVSMKSQGVERATNVRYLQQPAMSAANAYDTFADEVAAWGDSSVRTLAAVR